MGKTVTNSIIEQQTAPLWQLHHLHMHAACWGAGLPACNIALSSITNSHLLLILPLPYPCTQYIVVIHLNFPRCFNSKTCQKLVLTIVSKFYFVVLTCSLHTCKMWKWSHSWHYICITLCGCQHLCVSQPWVLLKILKSRGKNHFLFSYWKWMFGWYGTCIYL